jgi:hypothetical protein
MISAFLFSPRPPKAPVKAEPTARTTQKTRPGGRPGTAALRVTHGAALALALTGLALMGLSGMNWTHDPALGLSFSIADVTIQLSGAMVAPLKGALS